MRLAKYFNGDVTVESQLRKGTQVRFSLPVDISKDGEELSPLPKSKGSNDHWKRRQSLRTLLTKYKNMSPGSQSDKRSNHQFR